ncbi:5-formyltetrahydrofolate cyclo-ligase [Actibacterium ureilyticum]|uniref:5-formyltetrahydrofolate cyclo-ligase n=1 Tax=Actibacterium ureilyticum TaxID=1590614 RepID=UPI000BAAACEC|nr:5-formyltetrahydrofolate cyclo-ligase [Actibacterium ureilyticum]
MTDLAQAKAAARQAAFLRRKTAHTDPARTDAANAALLTALAPYRGRVLAGYMPIRTEIDPRPAMTAMADHGPVGVPVIQGPDRPLQFHTWSPGCAMVPGPFGALVPATADVITPDVLIVPLVAFDARGGRLGYGGGFYDRTLQQLRAARPTTAIGFAYAAQQADTLPHEGTDQPLDMIVTEAGVLTCA